MLDLNERISASTRMRLYFPIAYKARFVHGRNFADGYEVYYLKVPCYVRSLREIPI